MHFEPSVTPPDLPGLDRREVERTRRVALGALAPRVRIARVAVAAREPDGVEVRLSLELADRLALETRATAGDAGVAVRRAMSRARRALHHRLAGTIPRSGLPQTAPGAAPAGGHTP